LKIQGAALKATFTDQQKAIKKDQLLSRKEKKEKLAAIFSPEQKVLKNKIKTLRKKKKVEFKATFTAEQKAKLRARKKAKNVD